QLLRGADNLLGDLFRPRRRRLHFLGHGNSSSETCPSLRHQPPSTGSTTPVTNRAASPHRKTAASPQSSASPGPPRSGCFVFRNAATAGSCTARAAIGVSIRPGASTLTRTP